MTLLFTFTASGQAFAASTAAWTKWEKTYLIPVDNKFTSDMNTIDSHLTNGSCTPAEAKNVLVDALLFDSIINSPSGAVNAQVATVAHDATIFAADATRICTPSWYPNVAQATASRVAYNNALSATNRLAALIVEYQ
ncbi:MAG TPA: hypothetical protein VIJ40_06415 [Acidimicrobiales bacterium]